MPDFILTLTDNLAHGRGLEVFEPFMGVNAHALFPPLYPTLLTIWQLVFGRSELALALSNLAIDLCAALLIVRLGRELGHRRAGGVAGWLYLMWPSVLWSAPLAQKEGLCTVIVLALAIQWLGFVRAARPSLRMAAGIGASAGLLALTQPGLLPLAGLFGLVALTGPLRPLIRPALIAIPLAAIVVMLPWWVRNFVAFGTFVPLTSAGGYNFWIGNNPDADGHWMPPPAQLHGLPELEYGKAAGRMAVSWIEQNPGRFRPRVGGEIAARMGAGRIRRVALRRTAAGSASGGHPSHVLARPGGADGAAARRDAVRQAPPRARHWTPAHPRRCVPVADDDLRHILRVRRTPPRVRYALPAAARAGRSDVVVIELQRNCRVTESQESRI